MTPIFVTDLAFAMPGPLTFEGHIAPHESVDLGYAAIAVGSSQQVQGPVLRKYRDGRVTLDAGGRIVTGRPVNSAGPTRSFWAGLVGRLS